MKHHRVGTMQGRLVPKVGDRIQAFPVATWEREFALAAELGYDAIELTIETASFELHPVMSAPGRLHQARLAADAGLHLAGLCCDTVMEHPLVVEDEAARAHALAMTEALIRASADAGLPMVELPMMGANSLRPPPSRQRFRAVLDGLLPLAERLGIDILIESDLPPIELADFLDGVGHPRFGVNYDSGNSTYFGFHPDDELPAYGRHVRNVHVKDCTPADYSLPLGRGATPFDRVVAQLAAIGYGGDFILQAARQDDDLAAGRDYLAFTRALVVRLDQAMAE